ncbi:ATP-binding cassette domain-containing protein [Desulfonatronospira sp.]|uniref:ATP-binding cassette domain-containing protein n=1 Tax=Desulfonatronospira sp. TaxID=1962951 RepID=UPI0025BAF030|nr:ATP-binding cassette domain-containing protein [Desulfonatronospira sp.]
MLNIEKLSISSKYDPENLLVRDISFSLPENSVFNLVGETGSGKSILAWAMAGILPEDLLANGRITISGLPISPGNNGHPDDNTFLVPQEPGMALNPTMKIISQVAEIFRWPGKRSRSESWKKAQDILGQLGLSRFFAQGYPHELSGGMNQRCAIAMALSSPASLIIVDEPTKGLDANLKLQAVELLVKLMEKGKTLLCITHDFTVAGLLGGRTGVMLNGEIIEQGSTDQVLNDPKQQYTRDLIMALPENGLHAPWESR